MSGRSFDHMSGLSTEERALVEDRIEAFERAWQSRVSPAIADHLSDDTRIRLALLVELVQIDREQRAKRGEPAPLEPYQRDFPELAAWLRTSQALSDINAQLPANEIGQSIAEQPGATIGPYKLLEQIGAGGFGLVFSAEQQRPVRRKVALKVIKPGMDTREVVARFEAERQALALMDHPNIARVIDGGMTGSGRPYFVMELVRGVPITDYCDQNHFKLRERLELFVCVCQAVQHAHQKGIVHRDIKPSNVLVTQQDGRPVVKVIDFGVAKALYQPLTDKTIHTQFAQMLGTPLYMSPEQAEMGSLDIDTRSDIYSLGVLLYELLTGTTPFDRKRFLKAAYDELLRIIRDEEPPRPSTRLSSLGNTATTLAGNRGLDARRLSQVLAGDLDWVVMKALEKDRNRRYDTAGSFAEDIERYLHDEAILARPPSTAYRLKKFALRNMAAVLTVTAVVIALVTGTAVSTWQALRAMRAERDAITAANVATRAEGEAQLAAAAEKRAKDDALAREAETKAVLEFVENRIFAAARPEREAEGLGRKVTLRKAIESALSYVDKSFPDQPLIEARLRRTLGTSFYLLGDWQTAAAQRGAARALYTQRLGPNDVATLAAVGDLANSYNSLGRHVEALKLQEHVLAIRKAKLGPDHPDTLNSMYNVANSYDALGRHADALKLREETLTLRKAKLGLDDPQTLLSMVGLAVSYARLGRNADALKLREQTLALQRKKLGPDHPDTLASMNNLVGSYAAFGRYAEALKLNEETLTLKQAKLGSDHPDTLASMNNLANIYAALGRHGDAVKVYEEALTLEKIKLGPDHPETLLCMNNVAFSYDALGRSVDALKLREQTLALRKAKLGPDHPDTLDSMNNLAESYRVLGRYDEALKLREQTLALQKIKLGPDHADTLLSMGGVAQDLITVHRGADAVRLIDECVQRAVGKPVKPFLLPGVIELRLRIFQQTKNAAGCRQTAAMWEKLNRTDVLGLYNAARIRAVTAAVFYATDKSGSAAHEADAESDRAMSWLTQAVASGFKDAEQLKKDNDLTSLRSREDFKALVAKLERESPIRPK